MIWRFPNNPFSSNLSTVIRAVFLICPFSALADDIAVTSANGSLTLEGRFIGYDGTYLQLESQYGPLTVRYDDMSCNGASCPDPETFVPTIRLSGAARMADILLPGLIEGFGRSSGYQVEFEQIDATHAALTLTEDGAPLAEFTVRSSTTDEGFADLIAHEADIVMSVREARDDEVKIAGELGIGQLGNGRQSRIVALDAIVPIVSPGASVPSISLGDLADAFSGTKTEWASIGGTDGTISLHLPDQDAGLTQGFFDHVVQRSARTFADGITYHATMDDLVGAVVEDPAALGVVSWGKAAFAQQISLRDTCGFTLTPRAETLKSVDYPLTVPLFLYLPNRRQAPIVQEFFAWLRTPEAQLVVRRSGFVDPGPVPIALSSQGQRFANAIALAGTDVPLTELQRMVGIMKSRTRLSTTFRFEEGATRLDAQSRSGLVDLAQAIRDGRFNGRTITLIGFSDGRGDAAANTSLSGGRAVSVKRALEVLLGDVPDGVTITTEAFGEALPMGCDDSVWGRQLNRRVELWVD